MIARPRTGPWLVERVLAATLTTLAVGGLLGAVLLVGLMLTWGP